MVGAARGIGPMVWPTNRHLSSVLLCDLKPALSLGGFQPQLIAGITLAIHDIAHGESGDFADAEPREMAQHSGDAVPLAVPVVRSDRHTLASPRGGEPRGRLNAQNP